MREKGFEPGAAKNKAEIFGGSEFAAAMKKVAQEPGKESANKASVLELNPEEKAAMREAAGLRSENSPIRSGNEAFATTDKKILEAMREAARQAEIEMKKKELDGISSETLKSVGPKSEQALRNESNGAAPAKPRKGLMAMLGSLFRRGH